MKFGRREIGEIVRCGCRRKVGEVSCAQCTDQGNYFELIPTVTMETRHTIEGSCGDEFQAICNHCGVMAAGRLKTPKCAVK